MTETTKELSPNVRARIAGGFYLLTFVSAGFAVPARQLVISSEAVTTATNLLTHEFLFRLGFAAYLINVSVYLVVTLLFFQLFQVVNRSLSLLAAFFSLMGCAINAVSSTFYLAPWLLLGDARYLRVYTTGQLQALVVLSLKLHMQTYNIGAVFFGFYCILIGVLIVKATFLPRILGSLMMFAGSGWLTFLWSPLASALSPYDLTSGFLGEASLAFWLIFMGVDDAKWHEQACIAGLSSNNKTTKVGGEP